MAEGSKSGGGGGGGGGGCAGTCGIVLSVLEGIVGLAIIVGAVFLIIASFAVIGFNFLWFIFALITACVSLYIGGQIMGVAIYNLEHTKTLFPFYSDYLLGRALVFFTFAGAGASSANGAYVGLIPLLLGIYYIIGHWVTAFPPPKACVGGGSCSILSFCTEPVTNFCSGRGKISS